MTAVLVGGSHDGRRIEIRSIRETLVFPKLRPLAAWPLGATQIDPSVRVQNDDERYIYDSHDGPNCVIYRQEGLPPR
jgi:hypothetical protein